MSIVYRHRRLDTNEIFYVGIGVKNKRAFSKHGRNKYWKNITTKTEYKVEILLDDITREDACELEIFLITLYGRKDLGTGCLVNMTDGGDGITNMSEQARIKLSEIGKKRGRNESSIIKIREYYKHNKPKNYITFSKNIEQEIISKYTKQFISLDNIGKEYGVSRSKIYSVLKNNNIEIRHKTRIDPILFYELYITQNKTRVEISKILKCNAGSLDKIVKKYKIYKNEQNN